MTDREKAVVMAYTGVTMLTGDKLGIFYKYAEEATGDIVMTHHFAIPEFQDNLKECAKKDFIAICADEFEKPMQKPLTLKEALEHSAVWIEWNTKSYIEPCILDNDSEECKIVHYVDDYQDYAIKDKYNVLWRCWATKPTDEECKAAKWKEIVNETD